ncbi:MAG: hypothetical protein WDZ51_04905 [Pirellulaceae bacterium]
MWMPASRFVVTACCGLFALSTLGCGAGDAGPERRAVTGEVRFEGKPLPAGEIRFLPVVPGQVSAALIQDGRYEIGHRGGVPVGEARVEIIATGAVANLSQDDLDSGAGGSSITIPKKYNSDSELQATIEQGKETQTLDFDLTK